MSLARRIHERTPAERDRYLDFLRVTSILLVVVGHWTVRAAVEQDGVPKDGYVLALEPWTQWLTLIVQVLPIFFLVGGALNAESYRRARDRGTRASDWLRKRARRLLLPLIPLLVFWIAAAGAMDALSLRQITIFDPETAIIPVWFLAAYLLVTALTPATLWLYERTGGLAVIAVGTLLALAVDVLRFEILAHGPEIGGQPAIGALNFPIVILVIHQLGYLWTDARFPTTPARQVLLALAGCAALAAMLGSRLYPVTMVPVAGTELPNNLAPPSAALIALGLVQVGVALLAKPAVTEWLRRPRAWAVVAIPGAHLMTIFLWHQTALLVVSAAVITTGIWPPAEAIDAAWWATRPIWLFLCALVLTLLSLVFGKFESVSPPRPTRLSTAAAGVTHGAGVILSCAGIALFIERGLTEPAAPLGLPLPAMATLLAGLFALGVLGGVPPRRQRPSGARSAAGGRARRNTARR